MVIALAGPGRSPEKVKGVMSMGGTHSWEGPVVIALAGPGRSPGKKEV